ncbi:hypothetical protein HID58_049060, partial [Brassica napus]
GNSDLNFYQPNIYHLLVSILFVRFIHTPNFFFWIFVMNNKNLKTQDFSPSSLAVLLEWDLSPTTSTNKQSLQVPVTSHFFENDKGGYRRRVLAPLLGGPLFPEMGSSSSPPFSVTPPESNHLLQLLLKLSLNCSTWNLHKIFHPVPLRYLWGEISLPQLPLTSKAYKFQSLLTYLRMTKEQQSAEDRFLKWALQSRR